MMDPITILANKIEVLKQLLSAYFFREVFWNQQFWDNFETISKVVNCMQQAAPHKMFSSYLPPITLIGYPSGMRYFPVNTAIVKPWQCFLKGRRSIKSREIFKTLLKKLLEKLALIFDNWFTLCSNNIYTIITQLSPLQVNYSSSIFYNYKCS